MKSKTVKTKEIENITGHLKTWKSPLKVLRKKGSLGESHKRAGQIEGTMCDLGETAGRSSGCGVFKKTTYYHFSGKNNLSERIGLERQG